MKSYNNKITGRIQSLDLIKIVAMYGVVLLHTNAILLHYNSGFILYSIAGLSMPLFFMVSGYLMYTREVTYRYIFAKIIKIVRFCFINALLFFILFGLKNSDGLNDFMNYFPGCFIQRGGVAQFWYFGSIIIIYAMLPFLQKLRLRYVHFTLYFLIILFVLCSTVFYLNLVNGFEKSVIQTFRMWYPLLYFLLGGVLNCCISTEYVLAFRFCSLYFLS